MHINGIAATISNNLTSGLLLWARQIANENVQQFFCFRCVPFSSTLQTESFFTFISAILKKISMCYSPRAIFHLGTKFVLILISFGLKTGMNSLRNDLCEGAISSRHHVNRCREIYGDGTNSLRNETHSFRNHVNSP